MIRTNAPFLRVLWFFVICSFVFFQNFTRRGADREVDLAIESVNDEAREAKAHEVRTQADQQILRHRKIHASRMARGLTNRPAVKPAANTYKVKSWTELTAALAKAVPGDSTFIVYLRKNITVPAGTAAAVIETLDGKIDGGGFSISGLEYPFINTISATGSVTSLNVVTSINLGTETTGGVGALAQINHGSISGCTASGSVSSLVSNYVGGLVGWNFGAIDGSSSSATVSGYSLVGGLAGASEAGIISNSSATGTVFSGGFFVGGLVGYLTNQAQVLNCTTSIGTVTAAVYTGGLIGYMLLGAQVSGSSSAMAVSADADAGGLVGGVNDLTTQISKSTASGTVTVTSSQAGGLVGRLIDGKVLWSSSNGAVNGGAVWTGGFAGMVSGAASIEDSFSSGSVTAAGYRVAGFVGAVESFQGTVLRSYASGLVNASAIQNGGFAGYSLGSLDSVVNNIPDQPLVGLVAAYPTNSYNVGTVHNAYVQVMTSWDPQKWKLDLTNLAAMPVHQ